MRQKSEDWVGFEGRNQLGGLEPNGGSPTDQSHGGVGVAGGIVVRRHRPSPTRASTSKYELGGGHSGIAAALPGGRGGGAGRFVLSLHELDSRTVSHSLPPTIPFALPSGSAANHPDDYDDDDVDDREGLSSGDLLRFMSERPRPEQIEHHEEIGRVAHV